jgi:TfoX/Sxy family transcriptional regulator of competence genes
MATDAGYAKYVCDQLQAAGGISARRMFGEYGLYRHGKIVALIADNQLFVKPTPAGEAVLGTPTYGPPYPGAKPFFNVSDLLDDPEWLVRLIEATDAALPPPKKKPERKAKRETKAGARPTTVRSVKQAAPKKAVLTKAASTRAVPERATSKTPATKK